MIFVLNDFARKPGDFTYPEDSDVHHIGFIQDSKSQVDAINARLKADGWDVPEPRNYHGAWTFTSRRRAVISSRWLRKRGLVAQDRPAPLDAQMKSRECIPRD